MLRAVNDLILASHGEPRRDEDGDGEVDVHVHNGDEAGGDDEGMGNEGTLLMDATCVPTAVRYPTDLSLLNEAREMTETITIYRQQQQMYEIRTHSVAHRIVSVSQPNVQPLVRGKVATPVEFGAKISAAKVGDFAYLDRLIGDVYNEAHDLSAQVEAYRGRFGTYPKTVHADAIYRTRENRRYCKQRGIRLSGPELGRPKQSPNRAERQRVGSATMSGLEYQSQRCSAAARRVTRCLESWQSDATPRKPSSRWHSW